MSNVLLVRPPFPDARNNKYNSISLGLLKISSWKKAIGDKVFYVNGLFPTEEMEGINIDEIFVSSSFTYWADYTITSANYWKTVYPSAKLYIGGIAATLIPDHFKQNLLEATIIEGYHPEANGFSPDYSILPKDNLEINDTQIINTQRGCFRSCPWCGVWKLEPDIIFHKPDDVIKEILKNTDRKDVLIYDNNFLSHPEHKEILSRLVVLHKQYKMKFMLTQGFDDRILDEEDAVLSKNAGLYQPRFSYDHEGQREAVRRSIDYFIKAGYKPKELQIFIIINNNDSPKVIEKRYFDMYQLGVQIHSDRYRRLDSTHDNYNGTVPNQTNDDYFINTEHGWDDSKIKGTLQLMSKINYCNRHECMLIEHDYYQKASILNKGKSSVKLSEYL